MPPIPANHLFAPKNELIQAIEQIIFKNIDSKLHDSLVPLWQRHLKLLNTAFVNKAISHKGVVIHSPFNSAKANLMAIGMTAAHPDMVSDFDEYVTKLNSVTNHKAMVNGLLRRIFMTANTLDDVLLLLPSNLSQTVESHFPIMRSHSVTLREHEVINFKKENQSYYDQLATIEFFYNLIG